MTLSKKHLMMAKIRELGQLKCVQLLTSVYFVRFNTSLATFRSFSNTGFSSLMFTLLKTINLMHLQVLICAFS